ncbi:MAG: dihydrodipicolinate synthase family protein [Bacteroidales bacterium]|nr:dihydrodipicolinate synthase family protein [Bacteroidales bacterium]
MGTNKELLPGGMWPVMLTPFKENASLDVEGLKMLTDMYINAGSGGLFANCLSSEMFQLDDGERIKITETVVKHTQGKIPVVASGTFSKEVKANTDFIKKIYDAGVQAVIINSNQLNSPDENEDAFQLKLEQLLHNTNTIPLGIYECPVPYKRLLSTKLMKWMSETGRFLYFKDTCCDLPTIEDRLAVMQNTNLGLYNANLPTGVESMKKGARGISPIGANFFPEVYGFLIQNFDNTSNADEIKKLNSVLSAIDTLVHVCYPYSAKLVLQNRGLKISTKTRTPFDAMASQDFIKFNDLLFVFQQLVREYNIPEVI